MDQTIFKTETLINFNTVSGLFDLGSVNPVVYRDAHRKVLEMIEKIHEEAKTVETFTGQQGKKKLAMYCIILSALAIIVGVILLFVSDGDFFEIGIAITILSAVAIVAAIYFYCKILNGFKSKLESFEAKTKEIVSDYNQRALNSYGWDAALHCETHTFESNINKYLFDIYIEMRRPAH